MKRLENILICPHCNQKMSALSYVERKKRAQEAKRRIAAGENTKAVARDYDVTPATVRKWTGGVRALQAGING